MTERLMELPKVAHLRPGYRLRVDVVHSKVSSLTIFSRFMFGSRVPRAH